MPSIARLAVPPPFELWQVDLDAAAPELDRLSPDELARAARFVFERDRRRYCAAHAALRTLLSRRTGVPPAQLSFGVGAFGKPVLRGMPACAFNLSDSGHLALILIGEDGEVGVDLELCRAVPDAADLARRHFNAAECAELECTPAAEFELAFLRGWTRKEACLKAIGSGLSIAPETFHAGLAVDTRIVSIPTPAGCSQVRVQSLGPESLFAGAIAQLL